MPGLTTTRLGWMNVGLWVLLAVIVLVILLSAWWSTRGGSGE